MKQSSWAMAWSLLSSRERKLAFWVVVVATLGAAAQVAMISSILPLLTLVSDPSALETNMFLKTMFEYLGFEDRYKFATALAIGSVATIVVANGILLLRSYMISRFTVMRIHTISTRLLKSYLTRPYDYFLNRNSGDIGKRILTETSEISASFLLPAAELVASSISALCILALLVYIEPMGTMIGLAVVVSFYFGIYRIAGGYLKRIGKVRAEANKHRFTLINEIFGGIKDIKINQKENAYISRFEAASKSMLQANWRARVTTETPQFLVQMLFFSAIIMACLLLTDPEALKSGAVAVSSMIPVLGLFAFAGQRIVPEAQKIFAASGRIAYGAAALKNVHEDMSFEKKDTSLTTDKLGFHKQIDINDVCFDYDSKSSGLVDLTTTILKGSRVGIVGGTGAGKTTFVDVLLGLLMPTKGTISVDGKSLSDPAIMRAWRNGIAYVPQSVFLADASIAENIAFGIPKPMIDMEKVKHCAEIAQIHEHITDKTQSGYDTVVGDRGVMLSGGQRQRVGIARALYRDADLIVLDEATSALDAKTEKDVMAAIDELPKDITLIMIAHRLSTLKGCDKLLVLKNGDLVEDGKWEDLSAAGGEFAEILRSHD